MTGRDSDEIRGYLPSYLAFASRAGATKSSAELARGVDDDGLDRPGGKGPLRVMRLPVTALADVGGEGDDLYVHLLGHPTARPQTCPDPRCRPAPLVSPRLQCSLSLLDIPRSTVTEPRRPGDPAPRQRQVSSRTSRPDSATRRRASAAPPTPIDDQDRVVASHRADYVVQARTVEGRATTCAEPGGVAATTRLAEWATSTTQSPRTRRR